MNIAIIIAGGRGVRMGKDIPKQFLEINNKPIIIYTLEAFERHDQIDAVVVVSIKGWIDHLKKEIAKFNIQKVKWIVPGGETGQLSCYNGLKAIEKEVANDDLVIIHDAIRPIVPQLIITDLIEKAKQFGNASSSLAMHETLIYTDNQLYGDRSLDRSLVRRVQTPQAYRFIDLYTVHQQALKDGLTNSIYANTLMAEYGKTIYFSRGFDMNIKITTTEDLALFEALLSLKESDLIK